MENEIRLNEKQIDEINNKYRKVVPSKTRGLRINILPEEELLIEQLRLEDEEYNEYLERFINGETDEIHYSET